MCYTEDDPKVKKRSGEPACRWDGSPLEKRAASEPQCMKSGGALFVLALHIFPNLRRPWRKNTHVRCSRLPAASTARTPVCWFLLASSVYWLQHSLSVPGEYDLLCQWEESCYLLAVVFNGSRSQIGTRKIFESSWISLTLKLWFYCQSMVKTHENVKMIQKFSGMSLVKLSSVLRFCDILLTLLELHLNISWPVYHERDLLLFSADSSVNAWQI